MPSVRPPAEIAWIVDLVGEAAALRLIAAFGGLRIEVPQRPRDTSPLTRAIGISAARALARELGATRVKVPLCKRWRALVLRNSGQSYDEIARTLLVDHTTVHRWLHSAGMTGQPDLPGLFEARSRA